MYHSRDKETPLPVYVGLLIHGRTLKRELVDMFFQLGLSIFFLTGYSTYQRPWRLRQLHSMRGMELFVHSS